MGCKAAARVLFPWGFLVAGCSGRVEPIEHHEHPASAADASCAGAMCLDGATPDGAEHAGDAQTMADASISEAAPTFDGAPPDAPAPDEAATDAASPTTAVPAPVYLIDPAHTSAVSDPGLVPPLARRWTRDLGSPVSYPLVVNGIVYVTEAAGFHIDSGLTAIDLATGGTIFSMDLGSERARP